jgi:hypothetical protein
LAVLNFDFFVLLFVLLFIGLDDTLNSYTAQSDRNNDTTKKKHNWY